MVVLVIEVVVEAEATMMTLVLLPEGCSREPRDSMVGMDSKEDEDSTKEEGKH